MKLMTKDRKTLLYFLAAASPIAFAVWQTLLNNYVVEVAGFTGRDIGFLQSIREIPGFLAFTVEWVLLIVRQQRLAMEYWIRACGTHDMEFRADSERLTTFAAGKRFMGTNLIWMLKTAPAKTDPDKIAARSTGEEHG